MLKDKSCSITLKAGRALKPVHPEHFGIPDLPERLVRKDLIPLIHV